MVIRKVKRKIRVIKEVRQTAANPRHDDIYLVEFPKSGVTWLSFILANVMKEQNRIAKEVNFYNIHDFVPDIHISRDISSYTPTLSGSRIIKSHGSVNRNYKKVIYLWRDPREVMRSYYRFLVSLKQFDGKYSAFVRNKKYGVDAWLKHTNEWVFESAQSTRMIYVDFKKMKESTAEFVKQLLDRMGVVVGEDVLNSAIENSDFEKMRRLDDMWSEADIRRSSKVSFGKDFRFVGNKMEINGDEDDYIMSRCNKMLEYLTSNND